MHFEFMQPSRLAEGMSARGDQAKFGYDAVRGLFLPRIFGHPKLTLNPEPLHSRRLVLSGKALTLFTSTRQIHSRSFDNRHRTTVASCNHFNPNSKGKRRGGETCTLRSNSCVYNLNEMCVLCL